MLLYGSLLRSHLACGPQRRWHNLVSTDLKVRGIPGVSWVSTAQKRGEWRQLYSVPATASMIAESQDPVLCCLCGRSFRQRSDMSRHTCAAERQKPIALQDGSRLCDVCKRWFKSAGGLAAHKCRASLTVTTGGNRDQSGQFVA